MARPILATDFKDDIMQDTMNGKRRYKMVNNTDGTVSFEDVTDYEQVGNAYGAGQINATNEAVNQSVDLNKLVKELSTISAITKEGYVPDALAVKELNSSLVGLNEWKLIGQTVGINPITINSTKYKEFLIRTSVINSNVYITTTLLSLFLTDNEEQYSYGYGAYSPYFAVHTIKASKTKIIVYDVWLNENHVTDNVIIEVYAR